MKMQIRVFVLGVFLCMMSFAAVVPLSKQTLYLKPGWNLVTLIRPLESMQSNIDKFLSFKPKSFDERSRSYEICDDSQNVKAGVGYWIYSVKAQTVELALDTTQTAKEPTLKSGWNLIGVTDGTSWANSSAVIWSWKNDRFVLVDQANLQVGKAYWIYFN